MEEQLTLEPVRMRYSSGFNTIDAPAAKFRLTGGNTSAKLKHKMDLNVIQVFILYYIYKIKKRDKHATIMPTLHSFSAEGT